MNFGMTQAVIKCFERSTVERIKENSNNVSEAMSQALFIYTIMVINTQPRPQGLLLDDFQNGGSLGEDLGTQQKSRDRFVHGG